MQFGKVTIGTNRPAVIIAEAACEHLGSLEVAKRLADAAKEAGVDIIKYQLHLPIEMIPGSIKFWGGSMDDVLAKYNLDIDAQAKLMEYCQSIGIQFMCTPFSAQAADQLESIGVDGFKTGSGEMTNLPMLRHIARKKKPMIVSTGMATVEEIGRTVAALKEEGANFMLTHCTSAYPPRYDQINLKFMKKLADMSGVLVGHSDHTPEPWTAVAAVVLGAVVIEKHLTLARAMKGPDFPVSLEPKEFAELVSAIRKVEASLGDSKIVHPEEDVVRQWAHHSVVVLNDLPAGATITADAVGVKRPGAGIPAADLEKVYGRVLAKAKRANTPLVWSDLTGQAG